MTTVEREATDGTGHRRILIMGPPGVGKGTQALRIAAPRGIPVISTGDMFRAEMNSESELGIRIAHLVRAGKYVPDALTNEIVAHRISAPDALSGFLLDGYPRTLQQAAELDRRLALAGTRLDAVILLASDHETLLRRLSERAGSQGRADDRDDVILHRIELYEAETAPLAALYSERGILYPIDGHGSPDEVALAIARALEEPAPSR